MVFAYGDRQQGGVGIGQLAGDGFIALGRLADRPEPGDGHLVLETHKTDLNVTWPTREETVETIRGRVDAMLSGFAAVAGDSACLMIQPDDAMS